MRRVLQGLLKRTAPLGVRFNTQSRIDFHWEDNSRRRLDKDMLRLLRYGGAQAFYIGYETLDDATAKGWKKGYRGADSLEHRLQQDTKILSENGFWIHGMFVLGPQHTKRTADQIVSFARRSKLETLQISILTPFPGTPLMDQMRPHLVLASFPEDWDYYDGAHCVYGNGRMGVEETQKTVLDAHRKFYRWGGLSLRRIRAMIKQEMGLADRLSLLWANTRIARTTMRQWKMEIRTFLKMVRERKKQHVGRVALDGS